MDDSGVTELIYTVVSHTHAGTDEWQSDENGHWHVCKDCQEKCDEAAHTFDESNKCTVCGYSENGNAIDDDVPTEGNLPTFVIIIIVIGSLLTVVGVGFCVYRFTIRKKRQLKIDKN